MQPAHRQNDISPGLAFLIAIPIIVTFVAAALALNAAVVWLALDVIAGFDLDFGDAVGGGLLLMVSSASASAQVAARK